MQNFGYVFASKMLITQKLPVLFMYRETGKAGDSGWRFFSGQEDQDYTDNPDNIGIYDIQSIIDIDDSIIPYLDSQPGTAYERTDSTDEFRIVSDYTFNADSSINNGIS